MRSIDEFNTPRGYRNDPLTQKKWGSLQLTLQKLPVSNPIVLRPSSASLDTLPFEVRLSISNELSQVDCVNLMRTNSQMYQSTVVRLYQNIIVDRNFSQFSKEYSFREYDNGALARTYIKSPFAFKKLLSSYKELFDSKGHVHWVNSSEVFDITFPFIQKFRCIDLPDSLNTLDCELHSKLVEFFKRLPCLKLLVWLNDNFRLQYLRQLPTPSLVSLNINLNFSNFLSDSTGPTEDELVVPNLRELRIRPFDNSVRLKRILHLFRPQHLRWLELERFQSERALVPSCRELIVLPHQSLRDFDTDTIGIIASMNLSHLSGFLLNNSLVSPEDAAVFSGSLDLSIITTLKLKSISEFQMVDSPFLSTDIIESTKPGFLVQIAPKLVNLQNLFIDYREAFVDTVPQFLVLLPSKHLKSLDLTIKINESKLLSFADVDQIFDAYSKAIISGNRIRTLEKFSLEVRDEGPISDASVPMVSQDFYADLSLCKKLTSLRINPSDRPDSLIRLIQHLPNLTILDVFGTKAGGGPNLGLGMIHPNIYDEWFKVQHVAMLYLSERSQLHYIRINKLPFECKTHEVLPREGINRWFDEQVRV